MLLRGWRKRKKDLKDRGGNPIEFVGIDFNLSREEWLKKLVERQLSKYHYEKRLSKQQKINLVIYNMNFNIIMYEKHKKPKNNRYDKKELNYNQWTLISQIESIKNKK